MRYTLDTNILIYLIKNRPPEVAAKVNSVAEHDELCQHYARHFTRLREAGTPIGANDLWIACHALADNCTLVTHNVREFERIEGLAVDNWVQRL